MLSNSDTILKEMIQTKCNAKLHVSGIRLSVNMHLHLWLEFMTLFAWANRHNSTPLKLLLKMESEPFTPSLYIPGPKWPLLRTCKRVTQLSLCCRTNTIIRQYKRAQPAYKNLRSQSYVRTCVCIFTSFVLFGPAPVTVIAKSASTPLHHNIRNAQCVLSSLEQ
jgi:hypothetical protein